MSNLSMTPSRVAVVGGGASGVAVAAHLARAMDPGVDLRVDIFDPGGTLGRGIAYSTTDVQHLLNVPAKGMSLFRDDMAHFQRWAGAQPDDFVPRSRYGEYLQSALREAWRSRAGKLGHIRAEVSDVLAAPGGGWIVLDERGRCHQVDAVVLATGHQQPVAPGGTDADVLQARGFFTDPWSRDALADLVPGEHVVCIGSGLTFVDVALSALATPDVIVTGFSRTGALPTRHLQPLTVPGAPMVLPEDGPVSLGAVISRITSAREDWRAAVDGMRPQTPQIWQRLSDADRAFFVEHLSRRWDVLRHRMAPEVAAAVAGHRASGRLRVLASPRYRIEYLGHRFAVATKASAKVVDRVIVCTGPRSDVRLTPLGASLVHRGVARPGPFDIGYDVDPATGEVVGAHGTARSLYTVGPLRRGVVFESTAMPEISQQAHEIGAALSREFQSAGSGVNLPSAHVGRGHPQ